MPNVFGVVSQLPYEMPDLTGDFNRATGMPLSGSGESISRDTKFLDMDVPMSNDSGDLCQKSGNGIKTGLRIDMRVRRDKDSSRRRVCICRLSR